MDSHWICPKSVRPPATQSLAWVAIWQSGNLRGGDWSKKTLTSACKGFWNGVKCSENRSSPTACKAPFPRRHPSPPGAMHFSSQAHNPPFLAPERFTDSSFFIKSCSSHYFLQIESYAGWQPCLLAPSGALVVIMVYYVHTQRSNPLFQIFQILQILK